MSGSHEKLPRLFWVQIVLVLIVGLFYLFAPSPPSHGVQAKTPEQEQMIAALQPIGSVAVKEDAPAAAAARSGEELVTANCSVCHSIGLANAPKLEESAKADWEARLAGDMSALVQSAINGKGGMPPRGGDPSITDDEMYAAIATMLSSAGIEVADAAPADSAEAVAEGGDAVMATPSADTATQAAAEPEVTVASVTATALGESTYKAACFVCHDTGVANSPILADKLAWAPRLELGMSSLYNTAVKGNPDMPTMPAKGGNPSLSDEAVKAAVDYMVVQSR